MSRFNCCSEGGGEVFFGHQALDEVVGVQRSDIFQGIDDVDGGIVGVFGKVDGELRASRAASSGEIDIMVFDVVSSDSMDEQ